MNFGDYEFFVDVNRSELLHLTFKMYVKIIICYIAKKIKIVK